MNKASEMTIVTVMGKALSAEGTASDELIDRCTVGAQEMLKRKGGKMLMIPTGGDPKGCGVTEAEVMAELMKEMGVPADDIIKEEKAQTTQENAIYVMKIVKEVLLKRENIKQEDITVVAVTSAYHTPWVDWCFRQIISILKVDVKYESVAATGAGATGRGKIEHMKFLTQYLKANMELAMKKIGLMKFDEIIEFEDMSQVNTELEEWLEKTKE